MAMRQLVRSISTLIGRLAVPVGFVLAAAIIVVLSFENQSLVQEARRLRGQRRLPHPGDAVPVVRAPGLAGDTVTLGGGPDRRELLLIFSTSCEFCLETLPTWDAIARDLPTRVKGLGLYGVSLDADSATRTYVALHHLRFPIVHFPTERAATTYRAIGSPITLLIDSAGSVRYARAGVLNAGAVDSLYAALGLSGDSARSLSVTRAGS